MSSTTESLRKAVLAEVAVQKKLRAAQNPPSAEMLGAFIEAALANQNYSHRKFARLLDIDEDLAEGILGGILPESEIDDELLVSIAHVIRHEPNTLRIILGRPIIPTRHSGNLSANGVARKR